MSFSIPAWRKKRRQRTRAILTEFLQILRMLLCLVGTLLKINPTLTLGVKGAENTELFALRVSFSNRGLSYENEEILQNMHRLSRSGWFVVEVYVTERAGGFQSNQDAFGIAMLQHGSSWLLRTAIIVLAITTEQNVLGCIGAYCQRGAPFGL